MYFQETKLIRKGKQIQSFHVIILHRKWNSFNGPAILIIKNSGNIMKVKKTNMIWKCKG